MPPKTTGIPLIFNTKIPIIQIWIMVVDQIWIMVYYGSIMIDPRFEIYNSHLTQGVEHFLRTDPQLSRLQKLPYAYQFPLVERLPKKEPGIYTLGGGRQIGKSTLLKQWMAYLLVQEKIPVQQIVYLSGDLIDDYHQLLKIVSDLLQGMSSSVRQYFIIDEVTYIKEWDRAIKFLADSGQIENTILMLSGSDLTMLEEARMRFPGRRGKSEVVDFHLYPLSFREYLQLTHPEVVEEALPNWPVLYEAFNHYLQHGGYLTAINDLAQFHKIQSATFATYSDWIRGDVLKRGKQENYLKEILSGILKHYTSQISWHTLAKSLSIDHHQTVADYIHVLSHMDAVFVQQALLEDKLTAAPKKAKKIFFTDPFVLQAVQAWVAPHVAPIEVPALVETVVVNHFQRQYETFYIKADGEVDIAYLDQGRFWPVEIKWQSQLHASDLKQICKYPNAEIWAKIQYEQKIHGIPAFPLLLKLIQKF